jgi:predicted PurR-regulated permease PerM
MPAVNEVETTRPAGLPVPGGGPGALPEPTAGPLAPRAQGAARALLVLALALLGLWTIHGFLPALAWAAILAVALWPLYERARRRLPGHDEILLPALFTAAVAVIFLLPLVLVAVQAAREAHDALAFLREAEHNGLPVPDWLGRLPFGAEAATAWWRDHLAQPGGSGAMLRRFESGSLLGLTRSFGSQIAHRAVLFGFTLLALFFLFRDGRTLRDQGLRASYRAFGPRGERIARQMVASIHGTVDGLVLVGLGEGAVLGVAYWFAGVPHPVLLGALTAVAAMIPFGAPVVFGLAALLLLAQGALGAAAAIVAAGLVVVGVADHFVRPAMIGGATRLPFVWVLLGILGGVESFGLLGLFLGPAVMAALVLLWRDFVAPAPPLAPSPAPRRP